MGRTIQSATQTWIEEEKALQRFTRALRREDQAVMKDLIHLSRLHIAETSYAGNLYPMDTYIISMLLEVAKRSERIETKVNELKLERPYPLISEIPDRHATVDVTASISRYVREAIGIEL